MSSIATLNGVQYIIPSYNDTGWAQGAGNLSLYLAAIAANTLQPSGGAFTLTADADFGANFGLKALYIKSETANPASAGVIRLAKADAVKWRNNANGADISLSLDASDNPQVGSSKILLTGAVVNADINASAAIAYSKLNLSLSVVNADIGAAAAIALTKLAALGNNFAVITSGSGVLQASATTATEIGYVSGVTSAIQTQLNGKQASGTYIANPLIANLAAGGFKLTGLAAGSTTGDSLRYEQLFGGTVTLTDNLIFSPTTKGVKGTTTNDSAAAGNIGEYVESLIGTTNFPLTGTFGNATSISLTAGDWEVTINGIIIRNGATITSLECGISTTSADASMVVSQRTDYGAITASTTPLAIPGYRVSIAGTTTVYLVFEAAFSVATPQMAARLSARRMR